MSFFCTLPERFELIVNIYDKTSQLDILWFESILEDLLEAHKNLYGGIIENYFKETVK